MKYVDLPQRWKVKLKEHLNGSPSLKPRDFSISGNTILFEDGSVVKFEYSFCVVLGDEVAVFTEHCGFHIFQSSSINILE